MIVIETFAPRRAELAPDAEQDLRKTVRARVCRRGVGLGYLASRVDLIVESNEHALADRLVAAGEDHGVVEVDRPVRADRCRRPHRAHDDDSLLALDDKVKKIAGFLDRISTVRDSRPRWKK
jgi:hypothetical protein